MKTCRIQKILSSIATFTLDSTAPASCVVLITQSEPFAQRDHENVLKQSSQNCRLLPSLFIIQHKPGLCTTSSGFDHPDALCLMCFIATRLHKLLSWIKKVMFLQSRLFGLFLFILSLTMNEWTFVMHNHTCKWQTNTIIKLLTAICMAFNH